MYRRHTRANTTRSFIASNRPQGRTRIRKEKLGFSLFVKTVALRVDFVALRLKPLALRLCGAALRLFVSRSSSLRLSGPALRYPDGFECLIAALCATSRPRRPPGGVVWVRSTQSWPTPTSQLQQTRRQGDLHESMSLSILVAEMQHACLLHCAGARVQDRACDAGCGGAARGGCGWKR